ncbi:hypothetical protein ACQ4M4_01975 [Leptolyngbya sp. AN02str]|uniref:hypothetical protein n=1 Tax=Leptolyngbya sp. AN02str TaxID=3423363 RepID=UPI003D31F3CB
MLGTFQQSNLRVEVEASEAIIRDCLLQPDKLRQWMMPARLPEGLPDVLKVGDTFTSWLGPISVRHQVQSVDGNSLCLLLSQGIDGYHQWYWGDGWIQSSLAGVSVLPLSLGQTLSLINLKRWLSTDHTGS